MKFSIRALFLVSCLGFVMSGSAHAATVLGTVWTGQAPFPSGLVLPPTGSGTNFTVDGIGFNVPTNDPVGPPPYTIDGFLNSEGHHTGSIGAVGTGTLNNTTFRFTGFVDLPPGTYTISHDDGIIFVLNGATIIDAPQPTSDEDSVFVINSDTGIVPFTLWYNEVNGAPGVLEVGSLNIDLRDGPSPVPEPGTFFLLGSGLLGAAGAIRRRLAA